MVLRRQFSFNKLMSPVARKAGLLAVALATVFTARLLYPQRAGLSTRPSNHAANTLGRQIFSSNCAGCHGLDGKGTERAPNIATTVRVQKLSQEELQHIVSEGVPGTGMPSFRGLGANAVAAVAGYVRMMQNKGANAPLPGDPKRGEILFFGKGECSNCHMASGRGGFIAPDLTSYAQTHAAQQIKSAITNPAERGPAKGLVTAIANNGERYEGVIRNEDNFSLQLQALTGEFYFLSKADLKSIDRSQVSLMPADYASRLKGSELDDIVSYLLSLGRTAPPVRLHEPEDD
jgi:cytochrome c oxidase cbb3-type subunit III